MIRATTEASASGDATELTDRAVPRPQEEAALLGNTTTDPEADELSVGLPVGVDVGAGTPDSLLAAELTAISEGDPETAAFLAEELQERQRDA